MRNNQVSWLVSYVGFASIVGSSSYGLWSIGMHFTWTILASLALLFFLLIGMRKAYALGLRNAKEDLFPFVQTKFWSFILKRVLPVLMTVFTFLGFFFGLGEGNKSSFELNFISSVIPNEIKIPCEGRDTSYFSSYIGIADFKEVNDDFSDALLFELDGRNELERLEIDGLDRFIPGGTEGTKIVDNLKSAYCVDTGIVVYGSRNQNNEYFYCTVRFFNYHRNDTVIDNPQEIEFNYKGHLKYLAEFLLGHEYYRRGDYDKAVRSLIKARGSEADSSYNSLVNYYLGNAYLDLGVPSKATESFQVALSNPSVKHQAELQLRRILARSINEDTKEQVLQKMNEPGNFLKVFSERMELIHNDVAPDSYIRMDADYWHESLSKKYSSIWLLYHNDSLWCYKLTGYKQLDGDINYIVNSLWRTPIFERSVKCVVVSNMNINKWIAPETATIGWAFVFMHDNEINLYSDLRIDYHWYYQLCDFGTQPYLKDGESMFQIEAKREQRMEARLVAFATRVGFKLKLINDDFNNLSE